MKQTFALLVLLIVSSLTISAQETHCYKKSNEGLYNFWLRTPAGYDSLKAKPLPLVLFLHGRSLCGGNMERGKRYGTLHAANCGREIPAIILNPHNAGGAWNPKKIMKTVEWVEQNYPIDTTRLYVLGMSLGSYGTLDFVGTYPDKVAAAIAICGGTTLKDVSPLGKVPLWILHGTADRAVPISRSKEIIHQLEETGDTTRLKFTPLPGLDHGRPVRVFYHENTYNWFFEHCLTDPGRPINKNYELNNQSLQEAYQGLVLRRKRK